MFKAKNECSDTITIHITLKGSQSFFIYFQQGEHDKLKQKRKTPQGSLMVKKPYLLNKKNSQNQSS